MVYAQIDLVLLQMGGFWVNLGPLLYHWADAHTYLPEEEISIELCLKDVLQIAPAMGFQLLQKEMVPAAFNVNLKYACSPVPFPALLLALAGDRGSHAAVLLHVLSVAFTCSG